MRFLRLIEMGHSLADEEGTSGQRVYVLERLASDLQASELRRDVLRNQIQALSPAAPARPAAAPTAAAPKTVQLGTHRQQPQQWASARPSTQPKGATAGSTSVVTSAQRAQQLAQLEAKLAQAQEKVDFERKRLKRMGAHIQPNGEIFWRASDRTIEYDRTLAEQGLTRVTFKGGRMFLGGSSPLDTGKMTTAFSGPGWGIYVISAEGNMHVSGHSVGHRHHSSLLAGKAVAAAGELKVSEGRLTMLSNKSGHYMPSLVHLSQAIHLLLKNGVAPAFQIRVFPQRQDFPNLDAFTASLAPKETYEVAKLCRYARYITDAILQMHAPDPWRTARADEALGVFSVTTGQMVAHKTVRQWFKSRGMHAEFGVASGAGR